MQSFRILTVFVAVLLGAGLSSAQQSLLVAQGQVLAFAGADTTPAGDVAPGLMLGERFGGASGPSAGAMDDAGRVLFRAQLVDSAGLAFPTAQSYTDRAYFLGDSRGNAHAGASRWRSGAHGHHSQRDPGGFRLRNPDDRFPRIASNGLIMFGTKIWDAVGMTITTANDSVIYVGTPGNWQILAREGDVAPGTGGATYSSDFGSTALTNTCLNAAGKIAFQSNLAGTGVLTANNQAWFTGSAGNVQVMVRKGDVAPGLEVVSAIGPQAQMNASGQVLTDVTFLAGSGTTPVTTANDKALWLYTPGLPITEILREGSPFADSRHVLRQPLDHQPDLVQRRRADARRIDITGAVTAGVDNNALFLLSPSSSVRGRAAR